MNSCKIYCIFWVALKIKLYIIRYSYYHSSLRFRWKRRHFCFGDNIAHRFGRVFRGSCSGSICLFLPFVHNCERRKSFKLESLNNICWNWKSYCWCNAKRKPWSRQQVATALLVIWLKVNCVNQLNFIMITGSELKCISYLINIDQYIRTMNR